MYGILVFICCVPFFVLELWDCGIVGLCVFLFWILELLDFGCVGVWWNSLDVWIWMSFGFWDFLIWGCWASGGFSFGDLGDLLGLWDLRIYGFWNSGFFGFCFCFWDCIGLGIVGFIRFWD